MWKSIIIIICLIGYSAAGSLASRHHVRFKLRQDRSNEKIADAAEVKPNAESTTVTTSEHDAPSTQRTSKLNLPSNATSIRADIKDNFSCENRIYGYYADIENDCQIFHVCMPVAYADGKEHYFRWSFICPEDTVFSQDSFTCMHRQNMIIDCSESMQYYELNRNLGLYTTEETNRQTVRNSSNNKNRQNIADQEVATSNQEEIVTEENLQVNSNSQEVITPKPIETKVMPVKSYKPSRRKPIKPIIRPTEATVEIATDANINIKTEPAVVKKTIQKIYKRPSSASSLKKNKPQMAAQNVKNSTKINVSTLNPTVQKTEDKNNHHKDSIQQTSIHEGEVQFTPSLEKIKTSEPLAEFQPEQVQNPTSNKVVADPEMIEILSNKPIDLNASPSDGSNLAVSNTETTTEDKTEPIANDKTSIDDPETNSSADNVPQGDSIKATPMSDEEKNFLKQTAGGFEAVDSNMAAEAEALINDFLQTMLKSEKPNIESMIATELPIPEVPIEEAEKMNIPIEEIQDTQLPAQLNPFPIHEQIAEAPADSAGVIKSDPHQMTSESFQIPVTLVQTPFEEFKDTQITEQEAKPLDNQNHFGPISIDDVVASVKERLDQADANDTETILEQNTNETEQEEQQSAQQPQENIIIPIYHRFPDSSSSAQSENFEAQPDKTTSAQITQTDVGSETESQSTTS